MSYFQSFLLGAVQALTEFLPISSSGHLVVLHTIFKEYAQTLEFDTSLHLGTAMALILYFYKDLIQLFDNKSLLIKIFIGSIPAGLLGLFFEDIFENYFRQISSVGIFLIVGGLLLLFAEYIYKKTWVVEKIDNIDNISFLKSFLIGIFQAIALFPGISRSGATISSGMIFGLTRQTAAKFSFLLSIPIITAAGIFQLVKSYNELIFDTDLFIGFLVSFILGLGVIKFLLNFLKTHDFRIFIIYRIILGIAILVFFI